MPIYGLIKRLSINGRNDEEINIVDVSILFSTLLLFIYLFFGFAPRRHVAKLQVMSIIQQKKVHEDKLDKAVEKRASRF